LGQGKFPEFFYLPPIATISHWSGFQPTLRHQQPADGEGLLKHDWFNFQLKPAPPIFENLHSWFIQDPVLDGCVCRHAPPNP